MLEERVRHIEVSQATIAAKLDAMDKKLDGIAFSALTEWRVAKVVALVLAAAAACVLFGPQLFAAFGK